MHGRLQRGRGDAARRAASVPGVDELVYDCVRNDPRWDGQCESRALYFARLMVDLELPVEPIADHLFDPADQSDSDQWRTNLAIDVLAEMVKLSRREAALPLVRYAREGANVMDALYSLVDLDDPTLLNGLDEIAVARCDDDDLRMLMSSGGSAVRTWAKWRPRIARALQGGENKTTWVRPDLGGRTEAELADVVRRLDGDVWAAILELGRRRSPVVLDLAEELLPRRPHGYAGPICRAVRDLGVLALPRARAWAAPGNGCADVGVDILAVHGDDEDVPLLVANLDDALAAGDWGAAVDPVKGLGRLRAKCALPAILHAWEETSYAYLRTRLLRAMVQIAPEVAESHLVESLWDCEAATRLVAAEAVPMNGETRARLRRLRQEPAEDPEVRSAAQHRL
jgi:hypothetical protein